MLQISCGKFVTLRIDICKVYDIISYSKLFTIKFTYNEVIM